MAQLLTQTGRMLAYKQTAGHGPGIVFLSGLKSDMEGTKAVHLETWAKAQGRAYIRFDYSGHGASSERFEDGCIGDWSEDAFEVISKLTTGPQVLVGSSMGGWIGLLLAMRLQNRLAGFVGIAAAPDFTENGFWAGFSKQQKAELVEKGQVALPSEYDEPYIITRRLIEDGRNHLVLKSPLQLSCPVRLLQGTADTSVPVSWATALLDHAEGPEIRLTLIKGADHRFSTPECLKMIENAVEQVSSSA